MPNQNLRSDKGTIIIDKPSSFPYQDNHTVPWKYDPRIAVKGFVGETSNSHEGSSVVNIDEVGKFTRSGRFYGPRTIENAVNDEKAEKKNKEKEKEEEHEFLQIMKQSKYDVLEQLKKTT
ncbi:hypothetical protein PIB30_114221, partial [Stylosanthes scabra]|nr:hypothetical protein [Stylosanthes scabra]